MAVLTWYMTSSLAGAAHEEMSETSPGTDVTSATGWTSGKTGSGNYAHMDAQTKLTTAAFNTTAKPGAVMTSTAGAGNALRSTNTYNGTFAAANWTFNFLLLSTVAGAGYAARFQLWRGTDADGVGATQITSADQVCSSITANVTTPQNSSLTVNPGAITLTNEYLFVTVALGIIAAGGSNTCDALLRVGSASTRIVSADFTAAAGGAAALSPRARRIVARSIPARGAVFA